MENVKLLKSIATITALLAGAIAFAGAMIVWQGYVLSVIWEWFIAATFALPLLSIPVAIGLSLFTNLLGKNFIKDTVGDLKDGAVVASKVAMVFVIPLSVLLFGWIVKMFL